MTVSMVGSWKWKGEGPNRGMKSKESRRGGRNRKEEEKKKRKDEEEGRKPSSGP